jgi:hypothetical protein
MSFTDELDRALKSRVLKHVTKGAEDLIVLACDSARPSPEQLAVGLSAAAKGFAEDAGDAKILRFAASRLARAAEVFEFGMVPDEVLRDNATRAGPLIGKGLISTPFESCVFFYSLIPDVIRTREQLSKIGATRQELDEASSIPRRYCSAAVRLIDPGHGDECATQMFVVADFIRMLPDEAQAMRLPAGPDYWTVDAIGVVNTLAAGTWEGRILEAMAFHLPTYAQAPEDIRRTIEMMSLGSLADGVASAAMVLTTRNVKTRTETPSPKLQAKRERNGKLPLPRVTHVDMKAYVEAAQRTSLGGHHASPVPHLRRGHPRKLRSGREIWIRDMLINCRSLAEVVKRDHYEVSHATPE